LFNGRMSSLKRGTTVYCKDFYLRINKNLPVNLLDCLLVI
jgi:hypothetical protein